MEPVVGVVLFVLYMAALLQAMGHSLFQPLLGSGEASWFDEGLSAARRDLGFRFERRRSRTVVGKRGDYEVRIELRRFGGREGEAARHDLWVSLTCDRFPQRVAFAKETGAGTDVLTGDSRFDDAVLVKGEPTILAALLDRELRVRLLRLIVWDGGISEGRISWRASANFMAGEITGTLKDLVELADLLSSPKGGGVCECLARNVQEDEEPGVRLWNLNLLAQHFADRPETLAASRAGLSDSSPWVRLAAARLLPVEGAQVLKALLADRATPDHSAAEAAALIGARLPADEAGPALIAALKNRSGEARRQAIQELGRIKHAPAVGPLCVALDRSEPRDAAAAAAALGAIGDPKSERHLLDAIRKEEPELRIAAAQALGAFGSFRAVEPLLAQLARARLGAETRQALRDAVSAIQSRLAGAGAGQLSIATTSAEVGRLSLATPKAGPGDVSLASRRDA